MNSIIIKVIIEFIGLIISIGLVIYNHDKTSKILTVLGVIGALVSLGSSIILNEVPIPIINRTPDYSAIRILTDEPLTIEYKIQNNEHSNEEWIEYEKPFRLDKSAVIYARAKTLWYTSQQTSMSAYVTENGLVYLYSVDAPVDSIREIKASYSIKDPTSNQAGNHYVGYEIKKDDVKVTGITLDGEEKEITNFSYSPKILKSGKNTISIEYSITDDSIISTNLYVNGDTPALIDLSTTYVGGNVYLDTKLESTDFKVKGTYEDGTQKDITGFSISPSEVKEGKNTITITKDSLSDTIEITAIDRLTITESESEPNNDIRTPNDLDVNVRYSGTLLDEEDVDYYRFNIKQKGSVYLQLSHPKIDDSDTFWIATLYSQAEEPILELNAAGNNVETLSSKARVSAGVYYIKISHWYYSDEKYTFSVVYEEEDDSFEDEPNDDLNSQAMLIDLDKKYTGNLTTGNDVDYYKFTISEKRKVWIDFSHQKTDTSDTLWSLSLEGDSEGSIISMDSTGESVSITSDAARLPAGNYYLRINDYYWSGMDYSFCINSKIEGEKFETEDNNDYGTATIIPINASMTGNIQSRDDVDFYRFELKKKTSIKINFYHEHFNSGDTYWWYQIYNANSSEPLRDNEDNTTVYIDGDSSNNIVLAKSN